MAMAAAGYSAADADVLRRALARQNQEVIARERPRFMARAVEAGAPRTAAVRLFSHLERAAPSTFNRSHAVALALMVSWAAYLEAHHPGALVPPLSRRA
jgi:DNA polymerase III subunit alpha